MIDLKADDHVVAVWFAQQGRGWDWMACAVRRPGASTFELLSRHRHAETGESEPFGAGQDAKRWISEEIAAADEASLLAAIDALLADRKLRRVERVLVGGNVAAMTAALADKTWAHAAAAPA